MELLKQFNEALEYIENNLDGDISFDYAAKIACCSTYYFQRMFSHIAGVPVSEYIRRRRMTSAALDLQDRKYKISEISEKYGYKSPTSFNRAFQSIHGVAPSSVWGKNIFLTTYPRLHLKISVSGNEQIKYRIENKYSMRIIGYKFNLTSHIENNFNSIPKFWQNIKKSNRQNRLSKLMNQKPEGLLGVTIYNNVNDISYIIGVASDKPVPADMVECHIDPLTWAAFQCVGALPNSLQELYKRFYTEWLPITTYNYFNGPDLEIYTETDTMSDTHKCELWMAVNK